MKILLLYTHNKGYLSSFFFELSVKLAQKGYNVVNFSLKSKEKNFIKDNVKVIIKKDGGYVSNYYKIYKLIKSEKPDVIVSNFSFVNPSLLFGKLFGVKKNMLWFHSLNEQMQSTKRNVFFKKQFLKLADVVIANSELTKIELNKLYNVPYEKIENIAFWSNISEKEHTQSKLKFEINTNTIKIGCPGRMATHKNQNIVIEALTVLKAEHGEGFHLYFAGNGEEFSNLQEFSKTSNLEKEVSFLKHLSAENMVAFYKAMDVIVLPSLHEAFGLVFIEAISLGTPVIVSSQFGALSFLKDKEENISQFTFNPESKAELVEKLRFYLSHEGMPKSYFKQLYHDNFNKDVIFEEILNIIAPS